MANNDVLKISPSELAALTARIKEKARNEAREELKIAQHASPYIPQERPREGVGGTDAHPFDDFGNDRNPPVINPATGKPEWAGTNQGMTIAGQPEFDSFMDRFKKGSSNPKAPSLNHHSPEAQKLILNTGRRIRAM